MQPLSLQDDVKYFFYSIALTQNKRRLKKFLGLVALSVMSATYRLGHPDVRSLSAIDPRSRQWISIRTIPKDVGMLL